MTTPNASDPTSAETGKVEELKPCPFCGKTPELSSDTFGSWEIQCSNADCNFGPNFCGDSRLLVLEAWNRRPSPPAPDPSRNVQAGAGDVEIPSREARQYDLKRIDQIPLSQEREMLIYLCIRLPKYIAALGRVEAINHRLLTYPDKGLVEQIEQLRAERDALRAQVGEMLAEEHASGFCNANTLQETAKRLKRAEGLLKRIQARISHEEERADGMLVVVPALGWDEFWNAINAFLSPTPRASDALPKLLDAMKPVIEELDEATVGYDLTDGSWNEDADFEIQLTVKEINALRAALAALSIENK
jgi:hypothetical protein